VSRTSLKFDSSCKHSHRIIFLLDFDGVNVEIPIRNGSFQLINTPFGQQQNNFDFKMKY